ncbi:MAG: hypothetical protein KDI46_01820, partial [Alphaproteobacteria bacterium]|nr:hypothetical protein [Alphaproteobacteria bacterium]
MESKHPSYKPQPSTNHGMPFLSAEEAWFWFIAAQQARNDGARFVAGQGLCPRPCEPLDILKVLDRLYRQRRLLKDHLLVLRHYGRRHLAPDPRRIKEMRACTLWREALERIGAVLERKGIIEPQRQPHQNWAHEAMLFENREFN